MNIDLLIIAGYLVIINVIGIAFSGKKDLSGYFLGSRSIPWWVACFSIVATETSTLTFISIPGLAYISGMGFLQIVCGYLVGRVIVAYFLIPRYFSGNLETVYQYLQNRFSFRSRRIVSVIFHVTRLLADSVRLFATAIPLTFLMGWDYPVSILVIGLATLVYTIYGGIRSVIVVDSIQLFLYLFCAIAGMYIIVDGSGMSLVEFVKIIPPEKFDVFTMGLSGGTTSLFGSYNVFSGIIGGAVLSVSSHGTDHLIMQRVLSCRSEKDAKKAMVGSGVFVFLQFGLFLVLGTFLTIHLNGQDFSRSDEIMPFFIVNTLPAGLKGIMLAGIFAAAMSSLSSSINSLSASTLYDVVDIDSRQMSEKWKMRLSQLVSFGWITVLMGIAIGVQSTTSPLVEIGLAVTSITYGGVLGIFITAGSEIRVTERGALTAMAGSIAVSTYIALFTSIFWPWYVSIGLIVYFIILMPFLMKSYTDDD
ncbi:MAG: sodium:solute symporter [Spirochaetota bacterium]